MMNVGTTGSIQGSTGREEIDSGVEEVEGFLVMPIDYSEIFSECVTSLATMDFNRTLENSLSGNLEVLGRTVKKLSPEEKERKKPQLLCVYNILRQLQNRKLGTAALQTQVIQTLNILRTNAVYLTDNVITLSNLADLGDSIAKGMQGYAEDKLLVIREGSLDIGSSSTSEEQKSVKKQLETIKTILKNPNVLKHISNDQLLQMKLAVSWLMIGYLEKQKTGLDLVEFNFSKLYEINFEIQKIVEIRNNNENEFVADPELIAPFSLLAEQIASKLYFPGFWACSETENETENVHVSQLVSISQHINSFLDFIVDPKKKTLKGLIFLGEMENMSLFQVEDKKDEKPVYVLMLYGRDYTTDNYNFCQSREGWLNGLGHAPVYQAADDSLSNFNLLLSQTIKPNMPYKLVIGGFGLNGAVGQLLAFSHARDNPATEVVSFGVGTPDFVDTNAAATILEQENLYSLNFKLNGDTWANASRFSKWVAKAYDSSSQGLYPVFNRDWNITDLTGHDPKIYRQKVERSMEQPIQMMGIYQQARLLAATEVEQTPE